MGRFKPGDKLPTERDLVEQFQASRVAIREALRTLENSGFIVTRQGANGGAYVTDLSFEFLGNAFVDLFLADKFPFLNSIVSDLSSTWNCQISSAGYYTWICPTVDESHGGWRGSTSSLREDIKIKTVVHTSWLRCVATDFLSHCQIFDELTHMLIEMVNRTTYHASHRHASPYRRSCIDRGREASSIAMRNHTLEFGETLLKMEKTYREQKPTFSFWGNPLSCHLHRG